MKNKYIKEISIVLILSALLVGLINPYDTYMLSMLGNIILGSVFVLFALFASLFLREKAEDERDEKHRSLAGRVAFLVGSVVILIGITVQVRSGDVDSWLVLTLVSMIFAKIVTRIYSENRL